MKQHAFSLIELMIVITIIGILAAVAVPSYQSYVVRAKLSGILPTINQYRAQVAELYNINGRLPYLEEMRGTSGTTTSGYIVTTAEGPVVDIVDRIYYSTNGGGDKFYIGFTLTSTATGDATVDSKGFFVIGTVGTGGTMSFICGAWNNDNTNYVQPDKLPGGCNTPNLSASWS